MILVFVAGAGQGELGAGRLQEADLGNVSCSFLIIKSCYADCVF